MHQKLMSVTEAKLELQGALKKLQADYVSTNQKLKSSTEELEHFRACAVEAEKRVQELQSQFD